MFKSNIPQISVDEVYKAIIKKTDVILLDVRTPGEYSKGKIEGSINIPIDTINDQIFTVIPDKNKKVYVYCLSGSRSEIVVETLQKIGYMNVFNMTNGILMWRSKKYPLSI